MASTMVVFGEQRKVYTTEELARALLRNHGLIRQTCRELEMTYEGLVKRINQSKRLQAAKAIAREDVLDLAEGKLIELVEAGDGVSIRFVLQTVGKDRGYTDRHEVEHTGAVDVNITEIAVERPGPTVIEGTARELPPVDDENT